MTDQRQTILTGATLVPVGVIFILSASLVMVGVYIQKVDTLVKQMTMVQTDLTAIRVRLGIPPSRETVAAMDDREGTVLPLPGATELLLWRRQAPPRRAATSVRE